MSETQTNTNAVSGPDKSCSENERIVEVWRPNFHRRSKPCSNIATVRPFRINSCTQTCENPSQSPVNSTPHVTSPATPNQYRNASPVQAGSYLFRAPTRPCPFSFEERESVRRAAREHRLFVELQEAFSLDQGSRFRANPVRKYKPLVIRPSLQPLTIPRTPFSQ